jgi:hypothetical protein
MADIRDRESESLISQLATGYAKVYVTRYLTITALETNDTYRLAQLDD